MVTARPRDGGRPQAAAAGQAPAPARGLVLTAEQAKRRRQRNVAIGLAIGFFVALFYVVTIVKLGPGVLDRPL